jgi:hypothetical protein
MDDPRIIAQRPAFAGKPADGRRSETARSSRPEPGLIYSGLRRFEDVPYATSRAA